MNGCDFYLYEEGNGKESLRKGFPEVKVSLRYSTRQEHQKRGHSTVNLFYSATSHDIFVLCNISKYFRTIKIYIHRQCVANV